MNNLELQLHFAKKIKNIYEEAELYEQLRNDIASKLDVLASPEKPNKSLLVQENNLVTEDGSEKFTVRNNVVDFCKNEFENSAKEWARLNKQFLNYHKSLDVFTLVNSMPLVNYLSERTGLGDITDMKVVDVGAGTGHAYASFFNHPETIDYYLCDPNLRLLHDQFLRFFPSLAKNKLTHILCYAEKLPFKSSSIDLVMSLSSIDHFNDYDLFFQEAHRILKPGGQIFVASHLDKDQNLEIKPESKLKKLFSPTFLERLTRKLYYRKYKVGNDDHTHHFETIEPIINAIKSANFKLVESEEYLNNFWVIAEK
jgi:ubiquinone/menaquinone biosynthesis C-methylase UbiE